MKRGLVAASAVALLLLTGCTSTVTSETVTVTPGAWGTLSDGDTTVEVEPLTAESPTVTDGEAAFLDAVRANLRPNNVIPDATDDQLVSAGSDACEQLKTAETSSDISVIENEPTNGAGRYSDSAVIVSAAQAFLCP